jgi:hypothetical protein
MAYSIGLLLVGSGAALGAAPFFSFHAESTFPPWIWYMVALSVIGLGIMVIKRRKKSSSFSDGPLVNTLKRSGFSIATRNDGWTANGTWKNVLVTVQKTTGFEAARFARPWTIVVALPGQPIDPWPLLAEEGLIIEQTEQGFSVACTDLSRRERMHRLGEKLDQLINYRHSQ